MGGNLFRYGTFGDLSIGGCEVAGGTEMIYLRREAADEVPLVLRDR
jgi:hypothetical protein